MQAKTSPWPWVVAVVVLAAAGWWMFRPQGHDAPPADRPAPQVAASAPAPPAPPPARASADHPQHPLDPAAAADAAIPALADSDATVWSALSGAIANDDALAPVLREHLVQRLVTLVDNLPERSIGSQFLPYRPLASSPVVAEQGAGLVLEPANAERYALYVKAFSAADPVVLAQAYRRFYPLFQQAYVELGYPKGYFNDRLVEVIDHLLRAPEPAQPPLLEPNGRGKYRFSDPALESLSIGQKAMLRLGPAQEAQVKAQLRALRAALARG